MNTEDESRIPARRDLLSLSMALVAFFRGTPKRGETSFLTSRFWTFLNSNVVILCIGAGCFGYIASKYQQWEEQAKVQENIQADLRPMIQEVTNRFKQSRSQITLLKEEINRLNNNIKLNSQNQYDNTRDIFARTKQFLSQVQVANKENGIPPYDEWSTSALLQRISDQSQKLGEVPSNYLNNYISASSTWKQQMHNIRTIDVERLPIDIKVTGGIIDHLLVVINTPLVYWEQNNRTLPPSSAEESLLRSIYIISAIFMIENCFIVYILFKRRHHSHNTTPGTMQR